MQKMLAVQFLSNRFFIMGQVGAVIMLITSLQPFFAAYNIPAAIALLITITWDFWRGASKGAKSVMAYTVLLLGLWVLVNTFAHIVMPADPHSIAGILALTGGGIAQLLLIIGGLMGVMAAREMP